MNRKYESGVIELSVNQEHEDELVRRLAAIERRHSVRLHRVTVGYGFSSRIDRIAIRMPDNSLDEHEKKERESAAYRSLLELVSVGNDLGLEAAKE